MRPDLSCDISVVEGMQSARARPPAVATPRRHEASCGNRSGWFCFRFECPGTCTFKLSFPTQSPQRTCLTGQPSNSPRHRPVTSISEGKHSEHESQRSQPVRPVTARTWAKMADASPYLGGGGAGRIGLGHFRQGRLLPQVAIFLSSPTSDSKPCVHPLNFTAMSTHNNELYNRPSKGVQPKPGYQPLSAR